MATARVREAAGGQLPDQGFVDRGGEEVEVGQLLGHRQAGDGHPALDRARLLLGDLGLQQLADDLLRRVAALEPVGDDIVEGGGHARQLERAHHLQDLMTRRGRPPSSGRNGGNRPPADDEDANSPGSGWTPGAQVGGTGRGC